MSERASGGLIRAGSVEPRLQLLTRAIENEIVPRLTAACRPATPTVSVSEPVVMLTGMLVTGDDAGAAALVEARRMAGQALGSICLDLLAPAARRLGELWAADACGFGEVTLGIEQLRRILRGFEQSAWQAPDAGKQILLTTLPGEQHGFGMDMLGFFLRRAGWQVAGGSVRAAGELARRAAARHFGVIGLSAASEESLARLPAAIRAIRAASRNPAVAVLVGGPSFAADPGLADRVGADGSAADAPGAVALAGRLLAAQVAEARAPISAATAR